MKKIIMDFNMVSLCCMHHNCLNRIFYVIKQNAWKSRVMNNKKYPVRIMLICTKCGEPEIYGD